MAHDHAHHHGDTNSYYLEQLFTIAVCGALGAVMVMLYVTDRIRFLLVAEQHTRVLLGGAGLLAVALLRAIYVVRTSARKQPAAHTARSRARARALATMHTALASTTITNTNTPSRPPLPRH